MSSKSFTVAPTVGSITFVEEYCMVCNKSGELRVLGTKYRNNLVIENCFEMFQKCFNIKFPVMNGKGCYNKLCDECIARLRYCSGFRSDVEKAHKRILKRLPKLNNSTAGTSKPDINKTPFKSKHNAPDDSEDDHPLIDLKNKCDNDSLHGELQLTDSHMDNDNYYIVSDDDEFLQEIKQYKGGKFGQLKKLLSNNENENEKTQYENDSDLQDEDDFDEANSESNWSVKTEEMYIATGYYKEMQRWASRKPFIVPPVDTDTLICPVCDKAFDKHHALIHHYDNHYPNWLCDLCGMSYVLKGSFQGHRSNHSREDRRHPCPQCDKTYKTKHSVNCHIRRHHKGIKPITCYHCPRKFSGTITRRMHMRNEHGVHFDLFSCTLCHRKFFTACGLNWHMRGKHNNEVNYSCDICSTGFFAKHQLKAHMLKHSDDKIHKCEYCGKAFVRPKTLKDHLKIHLNIRNYKCDRCGLAFVQKPSLDCHLKTHLKE